MEPREKAIELLKRFMNYSLKEYVETIADVPLYTQIPSAKQCALIAVEMVLEGEHLLRLPLSYWQQVKEEIKLI